MTFWNDPSILQPKQQHRWIVSFGNIQQNVGQANPPLKNIIPKWFAKSVDKPSFTNKTVQAKYLYSHTYNFPTRVVWNPIKITLYDAYFKNDALKNPGFYNNPRISEGTITDDNDSKEPNFFSTQLFFAVFLQRAGYYNPEELANKDQLVRFRTYTYKKDMVDALVGDKVKPENYIDKNKQEQTIDTRQYNAFIITELSPEGLEMESWKLYNPLITDVSYDKLDYSAENAMTVNATIAYDWAEFIPANISAQQENLKKQQDAVRLLQGVEQKKPVNKLDEAINRLFIDDISELEENKKVDRNPPQSLVFSSSLNKEASDTTTVLGKRSAIIERGRLVTIVESEQKKQENLETVIAELSANEKRNTKRPDPLVAVVNRRAAQQQQPTEEQVKQPDENVFGIVENITEF